MPTPSVTIDGLETLQAIAFDVDGVLTDGKLTWGPNGEESKTFAFSDIMGVSLARRLGIKMALISGEDSPHVTRYAEKLKIPHVVKGCRDKATALREFAEKFSIPLERTCFFGDDVNDLFAMEIAGVCACPRNAAGEVLEYVGERGFVASQHGGHGAVREFVDAILRARGMRGQDVFLLRAPE
jgi:3-deoxy-D-manno-octulosonate 8-phosphate phosphatase (KDO 8-P phosphatase)